MSVPGNRWDLLDGVEPEVPPFVSVVVLHYEQPTELRAMVAALRAQDHPADRMEVLVVDDGSPTPPDVPDGWRLLVQEDRGYRAAAARNLGARSARGDVLVFLDADTAPEPAFVRTISRLPALSPEAVVVGRRGYLGEDGEPLPSLDWMERGYAETQHLLRPDDRNYRFVITAVLACRRAFFFEVGAYDEGFDEYGGEDWEWAYRAWLAGAVLAYEPRAVAWHDGPDWAGRDVGGDRRRRIGKNGEALRLATRVGVPGSRGRAVRGRVPDVVAVLEGLPTAGAAFVCVDALLCELPEATVVVAAELLEAFEGEARVVTEPPAGRARIHVELPAPVVVDGGVLREAVDRIGPEALGLVELADAAGEVRVRVRAGRALARSARWGAAEGFPAVRVEDERVRAIRGEPHVEAWVGGWSWEDPDGAPPGYVPSMTSAVHVAHLSGEQWVVTTDDDSAPPISTHDTRTAAETAARSHAMTFGIPRVVVHGRGGEEEVQLLGDVDPQPPAGASGPPYGPPV